jgi:very-short-patch-repair endonuclease/DNA polymerase III delta prime subunit
VTHPQCPRRDIIMLSIEEQLEAARRSLLDLSMRNRLLNYKQAKARTIKVADELPREVYDFLVLNERAMEFRAKPEPPPAPPAVEPEQPTLLDESEDILELPDAPETSEIWTPPSLEEETAERYIDKYLQTNLEAEALQKRLFYVSQQARAALEEQGYTILYLALGFLEWTESDTALEARHAPLVLVPVELDRVRVGAPFRLKWTGEDILTNVSLKEKLAEQGVTLPEFQMPEAQEGLDEYFAAVADAASKKSRWQINSDIYLDFFSFTKFVLYKDLDPNAWPEGMSPADHELIKELLEPTANGKHDPGFSENEVDLRLDLRSVYHIMDSDPSQIAVIEDVKAGRNLVVEGPPGTGKSQTITNVIAELLAAGNSVLFVSEKMAALNVVKDRLDRGKLGNYCLELHSRKSNKKEVMRELERTIGSFPPKDASLEEEFDEVESLRTDLNEYARALREPIGRVGRAPFDLIRAVETSRRHFAKGGKEMPRVTLPDADKCEQKEWAAAVSALTQVAEALPLVSPVRSHPWRGCRPGTVLPADEAEIGVQIDDCLTALDALTAAVEEMVKSSGVHRPKTVEEIKITVTAAKVIAASKPTDRNVLLNQAWNEPSKQAEALIQKVRSYHSKIAPLTEKLKPEALDRAISSQLEEYKQRSAKLFLFRLFDSRYKYLSQEFASLYSNQAPSGSDRVIADMSVLLEGQKVREEIRAAAPVGHELFGSHWQAEESDPEILQAFAAWIVSFRQKLLDEAITEQAVEVVSSQASRLVIEKSAEEVVEATRKFVAARDTFVTRVGFDFTGTYALHADEVGLAEFGERLTAWREGISRLQRWAQFIMVCDSASRTAALPVLSLVQSDGLGSADVVPCFKGNFAEELLRVAFSTRPSLAAFVGELHEKKIKRFMRVDEALIIGNRQRLARKIYDNQPRLSGGATSQSEAGILIGEINRKRGHMPIRKLMGLAGGLIQKIKPCFMMSPLSIAQFLDPKSVRFDVIVFDEASQVRPEDALGALLRGNQVVVMGDTRQLPPTSFFDRLTQDGAGDDGDGQATVIDVESILHQCKRSFPTKSLNWHYRSRHESLIAVSNHEFYDNKLRIYPSPVDKVDELGLQFVHMPDTIYDRGKSSINRLEARRVAEAAVEHYRRRPNKSLGIGTFNMRQQQAILEEIELQLRRHPEIEPYFKSDLDDHFFVKNLETIQGDERDVIFISVGFGFDGNRNLSLNFGPLNQEGGERRLNVLISRSRERCVVFANFRAGDLRIEPHAPFGLRALKTFLDFAETRNLYSTESISEDTDSPFEDSVYEFLRDHGYEVRKQIGCAGFRVDLGVVDPKQPGRYLLGIECDGAKYHSSPVARDRDRLRQQILEKLGWKIHRIWSTDWYRTQSETGRRLLEVVEQVKNGNYSSVWCSPDQPSFDVEEMQGLDVESHAHEMPAGRVDDEVIDYAACASLGNTSYYGELHEQPIPSMAEMVAQVVRVEGPVHLDEVVRRIRMLWGLKRAGQRIANAVAVGADYAMRVGLIRQSGSFLWRAGDTTLKVRRRGGDPTPKADIICDEEIAEAFRLVLKYQFATSPDDLVLRASRLFGFHAMHAQTASRLRAVLKGLIEKGELEEKANGMVHFVQ